MMKILVMGAGAVGSYFGAQLQRAGEEVTLCARGANLVALRDKGLRIESHRDGVYRLTVRATEQPFEFAPYDLVLFCVKAYDTERAAAALAGCLGDDTVVLTIQNGVENEEHLARLIGRERVMGANARVGVELVGPGRILHVSNGYLDFGELDGGRTARGLKLAEVFRRAGILGTLTDDLRSMRWEKLMWNGAFNTVCTLTRRNVGAVLDDPEGLALVRSLMEETLVVARAGGARIADSRLESYLEHSRKDLRAVRPSTLQDFERGKPLEYEALSGAVVRAARRHHVAVPLSETIYALLRLLDGSRGV